MSYDVNSEAKMGNGDFIVVSVEGRPLRLADCWGRSPLEAQQNGERLAACWNAMRGVEDPAAFVAAAREVVAFFAPVTHEYTFSGLKVLAEQLKGSK